MPTQHTANFILDHERTFFHIQKNPCEILTTDRQGVGVWASCNHPAATVLFFGRPNWDTGTHLNDKGLITHCDTDLCHILLKIENVSIFP